MCRVRNDAGQASISLRLAADPQALLSRTEHFDETLRAAVGAEPNPRVVIRGDAKLNFREVREAMLAIEQAGFRGVGLIAKRTGAEGK